MSRRSTLGLAAALALLAFAAPSRAVGPVGELYVPLTGCRLLDTRLPAAPLGGPALSASEARTLAVTGSCGVPSNALSLAVNLTVVNPSSTGFAVLYAGDSALPPTSNLAFRAHKTRASFSIVALASDGSGTVVLANGSAGNADFLLDVEGYFIRACTSAITVTNPGVTTATVNAAFSQTFTGSGGVGALTFSTASPLPAGLSLSSGGVLSGTPTQPGSFDVFVTATDTNGCTGTGAKYTLVVSCQTIAVSNPAVTTGTANAPFSQQFTETGGQGTTTFSTTDPLPIGLTLAANGLLSGTPTQAGSFNIKVKATDANGCTGTGATYPLVINCQTITVTNPATTTGTAGSAFSQTFTQSGAIGSATFSLASGTLPSGLALAANGVLSGTPTQIGSFPITVKATDGNLCSGTGVTYNLVIGCQTIAVSNPAVATATAGTAFSQQFTQTGAIGIATFTTASTLPAGLTLGANGVLFGTPTQTGTFPIVVTVTDANGCTGAGATYTLVVSCQTYSVEPTGLAPATAGVAYPAVTFTAPGGIGTVTFSFTGSLPTGMNLVGGVLSGTPTQTGSFPITVKATDANGCTAQRDYILVVSCPATPITLSPSALPSFTANAPIAPVTFTASGGTGPYTFQQVGALPSGLTFVTDTLSGTPTQTGAFPITITATDAGGCVGSQDYVVTVTCAGVTITVAPPTIPSVQAGSPFAPVTFTASGGTGPYTFQKTGALPTGMTFTTDTLAGTPTQQGTFPVTVTATDANGCVGSTNYSFVVTCPTISVTNPVVSTGTVNAAFSQQFTQTGGQGAVTFTTVSALPTGITLAANGVLSGTPTQSGTFPIVVKVTDANGCTGTGATYTLVISCQTITVTNPIVNSGIDGAPFLQTFSQAGAVGTPTFTLASGSLPSGWSLTPAGVLANAAPTPVVFSITVKVTDANGCTGTGAIYTVTIAPTAGNDTYAPPIVGNTSIDTSTGTVFNVLTNDSAGATATLATPAANGTVVLAPTGTFTYTPNRGYQGPDSFTYTATVGGIPSAPATVSLTVSGLVWFVNDNPGACSASCDGRLSNPYTTLAAFQADNDGVGSNPKAGDRIFLYESNPPNPYVGPVTLQNGQRLIGQDFSGTFAAATGLAVPDTTLNVPVMNAVNGFITEVTNPSPATNAINLVTDATVIGLRASASSGVALSQAVAPPAVGAAPLGTTTLSEVVIQTTGAATALKVLSTTGTLTYPTGSIAATGSNSVSAVFIQGGTSAITIGVPITSTGAGNVSISQRGAGATTTFNGTVTMTGTATGIAIGGATGANNVAFNALVQLGTGPGSRMTGAGGIALDVNHSGTLSTTFFANLSLFTNNMTGVNAQSNGTLNFATAALDVTGGRALSATGVTLATTFSVLTQAGGSGGVPAISLTSTAGSLTNVTTSISGASQQGISITGASGNLDFGTTTITGAGNQGISISGASATINFGPTTISGTATQGILIGTTTSNVTFGATTINGGTDAVSFQNNSGGTKTFASLTIGATTPPSGVGFLHGAGGGSVAVTGATSITNPGGNGIDVQNATTPITFNGVTISKNNAGLGVNLVNDSGLVTFGSLSISSIGTAFSSTTASVSTSGGTINATGASAILATGTNFNASTLTSVSASGGVNGISLTNATGSLTMNGGSITGSTGTAFNLSGGTANVTYAGTITQNAAQFAVAATSMTGGTKTFAGLVTSTTSGKGISLTTNTGATIAFTGGMTLSTGANPAFTATGGGTVTATQNNTSIVNTLTTTTGTALNVANTTIGAAGLTFRSISANGGSNGIVLNTTGASGGLTVTGNGAACTTAVPTCDGGTIQNMAGGDDSGTTPVGTGIVLNATSSVSLTRMRVRSNTNYDIRGTSVGGFVLDNSLLDGSTGTNGATPFNDGAVSFDNLTGSATVSNTNIQGGLYNNFRVVNTSGTLNRLTFTNVTFDVGADTTFPTNDALTVESQNAAVVNVTVQNSFFKSAAGDLFQLNNIGTGADDLVFTGNTLTNANSAIATGGGGVTIGSAGTGDITSNFSNNTLRDAAGHAILFFKSTGSASVTGTFNANTIGVAGTVDSGSAGGDGIKVQNAGQGTVKATITNNQIRQYNNFGIELEAGGGATLQSGALNATITGNTVSNPGTSGFPMNGIHVNDGTVPGDTYVVCADIGGAGALANAITGSGANGGTDFRLRQRQNTTLRLPNYGGANNDNAAVVTFVSGNNGGASGLASNTVGSGGSGFTGGAGSCP